MKRFTVLLLIYVLMIVSSACSEIKRTEPEDVGINQQVTVVDPIVSGEAPGFEEFVEEETQKEEERKLQEEERQKQEEERQKQEEERQKQEEMERKKKEEEKRKKQEQEELKKKDQLESRSPRRGTVANGVYTNEYLGLKFQPSFGFIFYNYEEIGALVGQDPQVHIVENLIYEKSPVDSVYEMMAVDLYNNNVVICYENLGKTGFYGYTEVQYLRSVYNALMEEEGYTCDWEKRGKHTIGNLEYHTIQATFQSNGKTMIQGYFIKKFGKYFTQIIITAEPDAYSAILEYFSGI